ncbi:carbonic anhydrase [Vibrio mimicus]|uniref:carbonic anhydrase n=1 Tax=Vibrio mimicus TaxID=674 RepID=UPI0011D5E8E0|nr:carbonic anhydrase [Vibrio mimicus]TXY44705.1 carbonic anhydrase [Vibrio mimicus]
MKKMTLALAVTACVGFGAQASEWGYEGEHGPEHWGKIAPLCAEGKNQSPIDVTQSVEADLPPFALNYQGQVVGLLNNGHTLQAEVSGNNHLQVDGNTFQLKQFHLHTPSENLLNGKQFPLEAHFVHADEQGNLAVVAVMYEVGSENPMLSSFTANMPSKGSKVELVHSLPLDKWIPASKNYYRFNGSLTTPPCSEGVRWIVLNEPSVLSEQQEQGLISVMGHNNRPVQPHNARLVVSAD